MCNYQLIPNKYCIHLCKLCISWQRYQHKNLLDMWLHIVKSLKRNPMDSCHRLFRRCNQSKSAYTLNILLMSYNIHCCSQLHKCYLEGPKEPYNWCRLLLLLCMQHNQENNLDKLLLIGRQCQGRSLDIENCKKHRELNYRQNIQQMRNMPYILLDKWHTNLQSNQDRYHQDMLHL